MDYIIIFGAKYLFILSPIIALVYFLKEPRHTQKRIALLGIVSFVVAYVIAWILGKLYFDPLPFVVDHFVPLIPHAADNGFPSDHTLVTSVIAAVIYVYDKSKGALLWLVAILVGCFRMMAGVHHPIDVIVSVLIALVVVTVLKKIINKKPA
jgi:undecaprenyl-diphosphatase